jgi:hypothetical protein
MIQRHLNFFALRSNLVSTWLIVPWVAKGTVGNLQISTVREAPIDLRLAAHRFGNVLRRISKKSKFLHVLTARPGCLKLGH